MSLTPLFEKGLPRPESGSPDSEQKRLPEPVNFERGSATERNKKHSQIEDEIDITTLNKDSKKDSKYDSMAAEMRKKRHSLFNPEELAKIYQQDKIEDQKNKKNRKEIGKL